MKTGILIASLLALPLMAAAEFAVKPLTEAQAREYKLDTGFYKKATEVQGILIVTSGRVADVAHHETAYQFDMLMRSLKPEIAERIRKKRVLCLLIGHNELTSQLPQFATDKIGKELDFYNWRRRGFLTRIGTRSTVVFAEEDVMEYEGGMRLESILVHEFGHVVHGAGFDDALQKRLTATFENVAKTGIWNDGRAAQRFRRVTSKKPVSLLAELKQWFPKESPELLVGHHYTRYMGDLSGGQILKNIAQKAMNMDGDDGLRFYVFDEIADEKAFKTTYRATMDELPIDQDTADRIVEEANNAFHMNMHMFKELEGNLVAAIGKVLFGFLTRRQRSGSTETAAA